MTAIPIPLPKPYRRIFKGTIDADTIFASYALLEAYASTNPIATEGQACNVIEDGVTTLYVINGDKSLTALISVDSIVPYLETKADLVEGKVPESQLPSYVSSIEEYANLAAFPVTGVSGTIYIALDTNLTYRWGGTVYVLISSSLALGETAGTAYRGDRGKTAYDHSQIAHNKTLVGLGNVDNTSDANKPISTATQSVLDNKADKKFVETLASDLKNVYGIQYGYMYNKQVRYGQTINTTHPIYPSRYFNFECGTGYLNGEQITLIGGGNDMICTIAISSTDMTLSISSIGTLYDEGLYEVFGGSGTGMKVYLYKDINSSNEDVYYADINTPRIKEVAPIGFRIPTFEDIEELLLFVNNDVTGLHVTSMLGTILSGTDLYGFSNPIAGALRVDSATPLQFNTRSFIPIQNTYRYRTNQSWKRIDNLLSNVISNTFSYNTGTTGTLVPIRCLMEDTSSWVEGDLVVYDGFKYATVKIGNQVWLKEPLVTKIFNDNTALLYQETSSITTLNEATYSFTKDNKEYYSLIASLAFDYEYIHPDTHPATIIVEDTTHRFVTDAEKTYWTEVTGLTKSKIEAQLTGEINTHTHPYQTVIKDYIIRANELVWETDGWIKFEIQPNTTSDSLPNVRWQEYIKQVTLLIETTTGYLQSNVIFRVPNIIQVSGNVFDYEFDGFWFKPIDGTITPYLEYSRLHLSVNMSTDNVEEGGLDGTDLIQQGDPVAWTKTNVIVNDWYVDHSGWMETTFLWYYNTILGGALTSANVINTVTELGGAHIENQFLYENCVLHDADMTINAGLGLSDYLDLNTNVADVLTVMCHWSNVAMEHDITDSPALFKQHGIAVGSGDLDDADIDWSTSYGNGMEFIEPTERDDIGTAGGVNWWDEHQQSPAVAIVAAKLKYIKNATGVSWNVVRMGARATATQSTYNDLNNIVWDKYRGFGVIHVANAIAWINNYIEDFKAVLSANYEESRGYATFMEYEDFTDNTPLPKRLVESLIEGVNYWEDETVPAHSSISIGLNEVIEDVTAENIYFLWSTPSANYCIHIDSNGQLPPSSVKDRIFIPTTKLVNGDYDHLFTYNSIGFILENVEAGECLSDFDLATFSLLDIMEDGVLFINGGVGTYISPIDNKLLRISSIANLQAKIDSKVDKTLSGSIYYEESLLFNDIVWEEDWAKIPTTVQPNTYSIENSKCEVETDKGFVLISPVFVMPSPDLVTDEIFQGIYLRDTGNILSQYNKIERIRLSFELRERTDGYIEYGVLSFPKDTPNIILSEGEASHNTAMLGFIETIYPELEADGGSIVQTFLDATVDNTLLSYSSFATYCKLHNADIINISSEAASLQYKMSNPNILLCCPHYKNEAIEFNHDLESDDSFYNGVVMCGSADGSDVSTMSYGRGMEFYEMLSPQSPATATICGKLKKIKNRTNATWQQVRLGARATASQANSWDKYKGFGIIDVEDAIYYIQATYLDESIALGKRYSETIGISDKILYDNIENNTPIPKRFVDEKLAYKLDAYKRNLQLGDKVQGGTIVSLNIGSTSGLLASFTDIDECPYVDALLYTNVTQEGYKGWRLPTADELELVLTYGNSKSIMLGDANLDGIITQEDYDLLYEGVTLGVTKPTIGAPTEEVLLWEKYKYCDWNNDNVVDIADLVIVDDILSLGYEGTQCFIYPKYWSSIPEDATHATAIKVRELEATYNEETLKWEIEEINPATRETTLKSELCGIRLVREFDILSNINELSDKLNKPILEYADNTAALAGGLTAGMSYHTAGVVKIVI